MKDVTFVSKGLKCSGRLYLSEKSQPESKAPAIILAHGLAAEKEMVLPDYATSFAKAGFATLIIDYRYFGDSEGQPRHQLFPLEEVEDVRNAITWLSEQPEIDPGRIGLWGTSYGGGIAVYTATFDRRVKVVVAQVPSLISNVVRWQVNPERWNAVGEMLIRDRVQRYKTGAVDYIKVVSAGTEPCCVPGIEAYDEYMWLIENSHKSKRTWINGLTMESVEKMREFDPVSAITMLSPTPLLVVAAERDSGLPIAVLRDTLNRAGEPKSLSVLPILHFEVYREPWLSRSAEEEIAWFSKYL